jgi:hypothetical protein
LLTSGQTHESVVYGNSRQNPRGLHFGGIVKRVFEMTLVSLSQDFHGVVGWCLLHIAGFSTGRMSSRSSILEMADNAGRARRPPQKKHRDGEWKVFSGATEETIT